MKHKKGQGKELEQGKELKQKKGQGKELEQKKGHQGENDRDRDRTIDERITPRQLRRVWDIPVKLCMQAKAEAKSRAEAARIVGESAVDSARRKERRIGIGTGP